MNIALIHYSAPPVVGGVESVLAHHARLMAGAGHLVRILAGRGEQLDPRIPFVHLPLADSRHPDVLAVKTELDAGRIPARFAELETALALSLREHLAGVDILIAHNVCSLHKNLPLTAALKQVSEQPAGPRLVCWHHDLAWTTPRYRHELHPGYPWDLLCTHWPQAVQVVVSELRQRELAELVGILPELIHVIPNGVDASKFFKLEAQTIAFVQELDLLAAGPLLLLPVRITRRKNIELALRALAVLQQEFPRAVLVVTGPLGPHNPANRDYLAQLTSLRSELGLEGSAHFLAEITGSFLPDEVIADLYRLADALLMPSREEGFGIPLLEAGLAGLPVFCTDIPPLRALGGEFAAYFSPDSSPEEIVRLIAGRLSKDPVFGLKMRVRRNYTWEEVYQGHIEPLLGSLLGGST
jgi:glycosyltransferase involved in cell wall biosynthesis